MKIVKRKTPATKEQFMIAFFKASRERSPSSVQALKTMLDENRELELWRNIGSAMQLAESLALGNELQQAVKEVWEWRAAALKKELGHADAPPMERLIIQQIALCWLRLSVIELAYSRMSHTATAPELVLFWEKRLSLAQRRFTRACESLARIRQLSRSMPALQVNIATDGGQQVNVQP